MTSCREMYYNSFTYLCRRGYRVLEFVERRKQTEDANTNKNNTNDNDDTNSISVSSASEHAKVLQVLEQLQVLKHLSVRPTHPANVNVFKLTHRVTTEAKP